jgi:hypothetical protein
MHMTRSQICNVVIIYCSILVVKTLPKNNPTKKIVGLSEPSILNYSADAKHEIETGRNTEHHFCL